MVNLGSSTHVCKAHSRHPFSCKAYLQTPEIAFICGIGLDDCNFDIWIQGFDNLLWICEVLGGSEVEKVKVLGHIDITVFVY